MNINPYRFYNDERNLPLGIVQIENPPTQRTEKMYYKLKCLRNDNFVEFKLLYTKNIFILILFLLLIRPTRTITIFNWNARFTVEYSK